MNTIEHHFHRESAVHTLLADNACMVWCDLGLDWRTVNTHLGSLGQFVDQCFEAMMGAGPQVEITLNYLYYFFM